MNLERNKSYKGDCVELMKHLPDESVDVILTDPPYLYLKNQKLDRPFDEWEYFKQVRRILKPNGFIVLFGRGSSFYRWNTILAEMPKKDCSVIAWIKSFIGRKPLPKAFTFKEEIIWDKSYCSSPLMVMSRVHETVSIHTRGNGKINKVKIPYLEMRKYDMNNIVSNIKRLMSVFSNAKSLSAVKTFLENNCERVDLYEQKTGFNNPTTRQKNSKEGDRCVTVMNSFEKGMNEKSIIRTDSENYTGKHYLQSSEKIKNSNRCVDVIQSLEYGMNEKSIIKQGREHYNTIHPTQKPPRLLERLLALVCKVEDDIPKPLVLDTFRGSGSTDIACINFGCDYIGFEINDEYFETANKRVTEYKEKLQPTLFSCVK